MVYQPDELSHSGVSGGLVWEESGFAPLHCVNDGSGVIFGIWRVPEALARLSPETGPLIRVLWNGIC